MVMGGDGKWVVKGIVELQMTLAHHYLLPNAFEWDRIS